MSGITEARADFAVIDSDLQFIIARLARIPTRKEQARNTLGIIFATAMLTTLAVLWFHRLLALPPMTRAGPIIVAVIAALL
jgi:hypothetical protein